MKRKLTKTDMHIAFILFRFQVIAMFVVILSSCDRQPKMRGYDFIPDMVYSRAYETYSQNPNFQDSMTMRVPVGKTVPLGIIPFRYTIDSISRLKAGNELINPFLSSVERIEEGKLLFTTFCIGCHGEKGKGDGQLFSSGLYPLKPRDISARPTAELKDGQIYHTITLGFGSMGAHGAQVKPDDRWKIVVYVRELQKMAAKDSVMRTSK
jgi:mono/diheme cytochrome c family protein